MSYEILKQLEDAPAVIAIDGGNQTIWKGTINPGTSPRLSFQALLSLVIAATIGQYRPVKLASTKRIVGFYEELLKEAVADGGEPIPSDEPLNFAGIRVIEMPFIPEGNIYAINDRGKVMAKLTGILA